jgi:predicted DCC family thiol-disulfide oxidoreductase YuxK
MSLIQYSPFQQLEPAVRHRYGLRVEALQGRMHLIQGDGSVLAGPDAITEVCRRFMPLKFICKLFSTLPARKLYEFVAQRRYRIFGCRGSCYSVSSRRLGNQEGLMIMVMLSGSEMYSWSEP